MEGSTNKKRILLRLGIKYGWILKQLSFFLFLAFLAVLYIANGHWADNTERDISVTSNEVRNLEYEYKNLKSIQMYKTRESAILKNANKLGLKISDEPPVKINQPETKTKAQ